MKLKWLVSISLIIFWTIVISLVTAGLVTHELLKNTGNNITGRATSLNRGVVLSFQEVAKHNSTGDCWLIINNNVYNVSGYLSSHPGGVAVISPYCGKEASNAFATKGQAGGNSHSSFASGLLANYLVGTVNQQASSAVISNTQNQPSPINTNREEDD